MTSASVDRFSTYREGIAIKAACRLATTANITLAGEQTIDGVAAVAGNRVLVKNQTDTTQNGVWVVSSGNWTRAIDFDGPDEVIEGTVLFITRGSTNADTMWKVDTSSPSIGSALAFARVYIDGANIGRHMLWVPAIAMFPRITDGADAGSFETTTNKIMVETYDLDPSTQEYVQFYLRMPKAWDEGTITYQVHWSHGATTTNFGVAFNLAAVATRNASALDVAFGTAIQVTDTGGTTDTLYVSPESAALTVGGTPQAEDAVTFQLSRVVGDAGDTMAVDARIHGVSLFINTDAETDA